MNDGLRILDENGLITYVNDRFCEMLGYSRDEMIGRHCSDFILPSEREISAFRV
jgi:two-component system sensor histidine kinase UhpB